MKFFKKALIILMILMMSACSSSASPASRSYHAYTVYPLGYLLNRIGGNKITAVSIQTSNVVQNSTLSEDYQMLLDKSLYLYHINGLEPYMDVYEKEITDSKVNMIDLSRCSIYPFKRCTPIISNGITNYIESDYYDGDIFRKGDLYDEDYFIWLDPIGMLSMARIIYDNLSSNYIEQSAYFENNFNLLENDLITLDAAYQSLFNKLKKNNKTIKFVSMTPSFGSWQKAYGVEVYPVCLSKYGALPTDSELQIIKDRIINDGVKYIAYEPNMSADMLGLFLTLESELGLKRVNLSNLSSLTVTQLSDNKDYVTIMYENLAVLENISTDILETDNVD